jgi:hypothetical protein
VNTIIGSVIAICVHRSIACRGFASVALLLHRATLLWD